MTETIKLGPVITYLIPQYRNIALLAKQSATLQEISNGRLEFRTGAGATHDYATQWWYPFGIDYPNIGERISLLDEGLKVLRLLWSKPEVHFSGKHFKINGARLKHPNIPIPITIAAKRKKMMQLAAKHADVWESSYLSPEQFASINSEFEKISNQGKPEDIAQKLKKYIDAGIDQLFWHFKILLKSRQFNYL